MYAVFCVEKKIYYKIKRADVRVFVMRLRATVRWRKKTHKKKSCKAKRAFFHAAFFCSTHVGKCNVADIMQRYFNWIKILYVWKANHAGKKVSLILLRKWLWQFLFKIY